MKHKDLVKLLCRRYKISASEASSLASCLIEENVDRDMAIITYLDKMEKLGGLQK